MYFFSGISIAGWGACSPLSGVIISKFGKMAPFNANLIAGVAEVLPTLLLPTNSLKAKKIKGVGRPDKPSAAENGFKSTYQQPVQTDIKLDPESQHRCR